MNIVVTGASGFIGANVVRHLNQKGLNQLILVDDFHQSPKWNHLVGTKFADMISKERLFEWLDGREDEIEAFIHLGACSSTVESDGDYLMDNNYRYTKRLAEYSLENDIRFIYASSAATYGDGSLGFSDDHALLEDLRPLNLYGYSKHLFDLWAQREGVLDQIVGLKYFNIFGPYEYHKERMASMVHHMKNQVLEKGFVRLFKSSEPEKYPDGGQMRDFFYVKEAAALTCSFLEDPRGGIFNCGRGEPSTWNELAEAVFNALGKPVNIEYIPMPEDLLGKYQNYTCADMTKFGKRLSNMTLSEEVAETYGLIQAKV